MKKLLSILGATGLVVSAGTEVVACDNGVTSKNIKIQFSEDRLTVEKSIAREIYGADINFYEEDELEHSTVFLISSNDTSMTDGAVMLFDDVAKISLFIDAYNSELGIDGDSENWETYAPIDGLAPNDPLSVAIDYGYVVLENTLTYNSDGTPGDSQSSVTFKGKVIF